MNLLKFEMSVLWQAIGLFFLYLLVFFVFGSLTLRILKQKFEMLLAIVTGFFAYYAVMQVLMLPFILTKQKLHVLSIVWLIVVVLIILAGVYLNWKIWKAYAMRQVQRWKHYSLWKFGIGLSAFAAAVIQLIYMVPCTYTGFDTQYYIGTVSEAVASDTMFLFDGATGVAETTMNLRYALSSYLMNAAVHCRVFHVSALIETKVIMVAIVWAVSNLMIYQIARLFLTGKKAKYAPIAVGFAVILNFFFDTLYTTSEFLMSRSYEGKSVVANIVLPGVILFCGWIWKEKDTLFAWSCMFLLCIASNAISLSAMLILPIYITAFVFAKYLEKPKEWKIVIPYAICMLPLAAVLVVYYLSTKGIIVITV